MPKIFLSKFKQNFDCTFPMWGMVPIYQAIFYESFFKILNMYIVLEILRENQISDWSGEADHTSWIPAIPHETEGRVWYELAGIQRVWSDLPDQSHLVFFLCHGF